LNILDKIFQERKKNTAIIGSVLLFLLMLFLFWDMSGADTLSSAEIQKWLSNMGKDDVLDLSMYQKNTAGAESFSEYAQRDQDLELVYSVSDTNVCNISFTLTWTDEEDTGWIGSSPNHENQPDEFLIVFTSPDGNITKSFNGKNDYNQEGRVEGNVMVPVLTGNSKNGTGTWSIKISVNPGDHEPRYIGAFRFLDNGNDFQLVVEHDFLSITE